MFKKPVTEQEIRGDIFKDLDKGHIHLSDGSDLFGENDEFSYFPQSNELNTQFPRLQDSNGKLIPNNKELDRVEEHVIKSLLSTWQGELNVIEVGAGIGRTAAIISQNPRINYDHASLTALAPHFMPKNESQAWTRESLNTDKPVEVFTRLDENNRYIGEQFVGPLEKQEKLPKQKYGLAIEKCGPFYYAKDIETLLELTKRLIPAMKPNGVIMFMSLAFTYKIAQAFTEIAPKWEMSKHNIYFFARGPECKHLDFLFDERSRLYSE